ncbi:reverse transcriptase domain-containing protein [Tanacetum coccineum]
MSSSGSKISSLTSGEVKSLEAVISYVHRLCHFHYRQEGSFFSMIQYKATRAFVRTGSTQDEGDMRIAFIINNDKISGKCELSNRKKDISCNSGRSANLTISKFKSHLGGNKLGYTIKVPPPQVQKAKPPSQRNFVIHQRDPRYPHIPYPSRMNQEKQKEKDEVQIHKFWHMFKQLHINISLADALILIPKYQKMLKSLLSNKEKLIELANTPLNENCSAVILKKLPEKLGDPGKFLIPCGFSELKCKALADLGASINLMPLSVWKKLGLPELISTQMTLELANRDICTPKGIARDVFVPVGKFTFPADFVIVDYESDQQVPLILGRPFLRTARALIDVHREEMILCDGNERLILNMRNDTSSYSNEPHQESINMIDVYNVSHEDYREDLFAANHPSGNPTSSFSSHTDLTSPKVNDDIFDPEEDIIENLLNLDKTKDLPPYHDNQSSGNPTTISEPETKSSSSSPTLISFEERNSNPSSLLPPFHNSLSSNTTSSSHSLLIYEISDYFLEEFANELALITFPPRNDDLPFDAKSDLRELEYLLNHDPINEMDSILEDSVDENSPDNNLVDTISEMFTDENALDYSSPPLWDEYDDELFDLETVNDDTYDDPFDSKEEKIKDSKILIDELDPPRSSDFLLFPDCDSVFYEDFSEDDALPSTNNEDKVFNPGILIHENLFEVTNCVTMKKNVKKTTNASLILEDFNPPLYELSFYKEVPGHGALLSFSSKNEEKVFNPRILTSKRVHTSLHPELSHRGSKAFNVTKILESPMKIFPCSYQENIRVLDVPMSRIFETSRARGFCPSITRASNPQLPFGNPISKSYRLTFIFNDMSNSDELRHTDNTTLVPPRLPDTLPQVYHRRRPTLGLLILPSVSPFPPTIRRTARISIPPIEPNLAERAKISAINLDDYQIDLVTPPPSPSSPFTIAAYQRMISETDPTQREEALTKTGQNSVLVPETALTVCTTCLRGQLHTILEDMDHYPNSCLEELEAFMTLWDVKPRVEESSLETLSMDELITQLRKICEDAEDRASNAQEEA